MDSEVATKVENFFSQYNTRRYTKGHVLVLSGDSPQHIFHLVKGSVKQYDISSKGDEIILNVFKPPAFFPLSLAINKSKSSYIYEADTDIEVNLAPAEQVITFLKENNDVLFDLLTRVYRGTDGLIGRLAQLMTGSAQSRLIYELILEARRFGKPDENNNGCLLSISEKDLGQRAGLSRETVSREVHKLIDKNMLTKHKKGVYINDVDRLKHMLGEVM